MGPKLNNNANGIIVACKECNWEIPEDLVKRLISEESVFCEKCGFSIEKKDYNLTELEKKEQSVVLKNRVKILKSKGKKVYKRVSMKLKDMRDKYQND